VNAYQTPAELLKAIAHPTRLHILELLAHDEACVCHLAAVLRRRQPYVSQHLMGLREAGLALDRKDGVIVYYRLANPNVMELIAAARAVLRAAGQAVEPPPIPIGPVVGCPCPKCLEGGNCCPSKKARA